MTGNITPETVATIAALGFDVYAPAKGLTTWLYYTDGKRIGYLQLDRLYGWRMTSVHIPNRECGTGFGMHDNGEGFEFTRECMERAFCIAPQWASQTMRNAVVKYKDMGDFLRAQSIIQYDCIAQGVKQ